MRLYKLLQMQFGLQSALSTFQRAMDIILLTVKWKFALVYLDDIVSFSRFVGKQLDHKMIVVDLFSRADMGLELEKFIFF